MLQNEYLIAKIGVDTGENEPIEKSENEPMEKGSGGGGHRKA